MKWILSLIITLVLSISGYCEILPDGTKFNLYDDFSGGLNTRDPPHKLQVNESPYIRNCYIDEGEIDPPGGTIISGSTNTLSKINLFKRYVKSDGSIEYIVSDSSVVLKTQDFSIYTLLKSGLNNNYRLRAKQIENKVYFTNGSDPVFNYDGSTVVVLDGGTYNIGKTPNIPKFKYLEYYQNRMWGFNLPTDPSALRWNLLLSTDTVPIAYAPDHELAWSNSNLQLNIDKGNGTVGTFMRVYAGQLYVGKERGIHYIYGNDDTNYSAVPIVKDYGFLTDESVVEQDNVLIGFGNDGVYEFNGQQMNRISDKIYPDVQNFNLGVSRNVVLTWDSRSEFLRGYFSGSTVTSAGLIKLTTGFYSAVVPTSPVVDIMTYATFTFVNGGSSSTIPMAILSTYTLPSNYLFKLGTTLDTFSIKLYLKQYDTDSKNPAINVRNTVTNQQYEWFPAAPVSVGGGWVSFDFPTTSMFEFTGDDVNNGRIVIKAMIGSIEAGKPWYVQIPSISAHISLIPANVGEYRSDITTTSQLSFWSSFNSDYNSNSGNVQFFIRTATSVVNIATYPYTPISPGSIISAAQSNAFIQWAATFTASNSQVQPSLDNVVILYQQGGAADSGALGASWKNRYYLSVTTTADAMTSLIYVKSRSGTKNPTGWTVLEGINTKSFLITPDIWYGGSSSAGVVMRLDYGTNFNGSPINQVYDTNENNFEQPFLNKNILEFGLDTDYVSNSTYTLAMSIDRGDYVSQDINNSGSGRMIRRLAYPNQKGNSFKWRFSNNQLDKPMKIYNWIAYFKENATRTNTP